MAEEEEYAKTACKKKLSCGHMCGGIAGEEPHLPCLHRCRPSDQKRLRQDADDWCMICYSETLADAPAIQTPIDHPALKALLEPIEALKEDVRTKALMRLEYEGLDKDNAITKPGARFYQDPAGFAMDKYSFYDCFKCNKPYYGGEARCDAAAVYEAENYNLSEYLCGSCSDASRARMCDKHGADYLVYKCRYCCSLAVFFCFGTTHFCKSCHDDHTRITAIPKEDLPHCPAGPKGVQLHGGECPLHISHPPTGEEFALGCGVCENVWTVESHHHGKKQNYDFNDKTVEFQSDFVH